MGESKEKIFFKDIRSGIYMCVYCGGEKIATSPDHIPPITMFFGRKRPNDLVVPSCQQCNFNTSPLDQFIGLMSRMYSGSSNNDYTLEIEKSMQAVRNNLPEVYSGIHAKSWHDTFRSPNKGMHILDLSDVYIQKCFAMFSAKLGFALHWRATKTICPMSGGAFSYIFTNFNALEKNIPSSLFEIFKKFRSLEDGKQHTRGQFEYDSLILDDGISAHLSIFRVSFMIMTFVYTCENKINREIKAEIIKPGHFSEKYPYGLPKLSNDQIRLRLVQSKFALARSESLDNGKLFIPFLS